VPRSLRSLARRPDRIEPSGEEPREGSAEDATLGTEAHGSCRGRRDELVFPGTDGGYLDASALRRRYGKAQATAGLPDASAEECAGR
jgi:hypothetical protein